MFHVHQGFCRRVDGTRENDFFLPAGTDAITKIDQDHDGSDGAATLLQACNRQSALTDARIDGNDAQRLSDRTCHGIEDFVCQRRYVMAYGYPDGPKRADRAPTRSRRRCAVAVRVRVRMGPRT